MIGARLWMRNASITPQDPAGASVFLDGLDDVLDFGFERVDLRLMRIGNHAAYDGNALDDLGNGLHQQQSKSDHDQRFCRPPRQLIVDDIDADMLVLQQRPWRA